MKLISYLAAGLFLLSCFLHSYPIDPDETATLDGYELEFRTHQEGLTIAAPIVFIAEGYSESERNDFLAKVDEYISGISTVTPFYEFFDHYTFYSIFVASDDSGIDYPKSNPPVSVDTFYGGYGSTANPKKSLGISSIPRLSGSLGLFSDLTSKINVYPVILMNGFGRSRSLNGVVYLELSSYNNHYMTLVHELAHLIGNVRDEYSYAGDVTSDGPNVQRFSEEDILDGIEPSDVKWSEWLTPQVSLPTLRHPESNGYFDVSTMTYISCDVDDPTVGLFEGGGHTTVNIFRPTCECIMRAHSSPTSKFCPICREAITYQTLLNSIGVSAMTPMSTNLIPEDYVEEASITFSLELSAPYISGLEYRWYLNNELISETGSSFTILRPSYGWVHKIIKVEIYPTGFIGHQGFIIGNLDIPIKTVEWNIDYASSNIPNLRWWINGAGLDDGHENSIFSFGRTVNIKADANDNGPAVLGQLKQFAYNARNHMILPISYEASVYDIDRPGSEIETMISGFLDSSSVHNPDNFSPINLGQLKAVAKPFYDRLDALGYNTQAMLVSRGYPPSWPYIYPWNPTTPVSENYTMVTIGQLKLVFSFDLEPFYTP